MKTHQTLSLSLFFIIFFSHYSSAQVIVTVAGYNMAGYNGDGIPATAADLYEPYGVALDDSGNLYICDALNNRIRKVSPAYYGVITTIAGNGGSGYSGDGGLGINAEVSGAYDIAVDRHGNVYIPAAYTVRKITPADTITAIAGTGVPGYNGDGIPATAAQINDATGVTVDSIGNVYFADARNHRLRKVDTAGIITTIAGTGVAGFSPDGSRADTARLGALVSIRIDKAGNFFYYDSARIRKIDTGGIITTIVGNGIYGYSGDSIIATAAEIGGSAIAIDSAGNLFIADEFTNRIREVNTAGVIYTVAGGGSTFADGVNPLQALLDGPEGVAVNNAGDIYTGDAGESRVRLVTKHPLGVPFDKLTMTGIQVWPNPSNGFFSFLIASSTDEQSIVTITNVLGEKIKEFSIITNKQVDVKLCVPQGIYFLSATSEQKTFNQKIIVQ